MDQEVKYPECEKVAKHREKIAELVDFMAHLELNGIMPRMYANSHQGVVYNYLGINQKRLDAERESLLKKAQGGE